MERLDKIVSKDHCNPADLWHFIQILSHFLSDRPELMNLVGIRKIPDFRTLSYRALRIDWHEINAGIIDLTVSNVENAVIDSFIVKTCKHTTAQRR